MKRSFKVDDLSQSQVLDCEDDTHTDAGPIWSVMIRPPREFLLGRSWKQPTQIGRAWDSKHSGWYVTPYQYAPWDSTKAPHRGGFKSLREGALWLLGVHDAETMAECMAQIKELDKMQRTDVIDFAGGVEIGNVCDNL